MMKSGDNRNKTKPTVKAGVESPGSINPAQLKSKVGLKKRLLSIDQFVKGIKAGDRVVLGKAITLIESQNLEHRILAQELVERCLKNRNSSIRIGITGAPGVGKSTFIEAFGNYCIEKGNRVAVLAVDPTSQLTKGSILGDKTRMLTLSSTEQAFVRPSPAGNSLGGVARKTRESIILCEAAGFDTIIIETVGVGQSEIAVHSMVDFFLLLLLPSAGDELQGIKRGIVEMADMVAINKADGDLINAAKRSKKDYRNGLHMFPPKDSGWTPQVLTCSAVEQKGIDDIFNSIQDFKKLTNKNKYFKNNRKQQSSHWMMETIKQNLQDMFYNNPSVKKQLKQVESDVIANKISSTKAAEMLLKLFMKS